MQGFGRKTQAQTAVRALRAIPARTKSKGGRMRARYFLLGGTLAYRL
jgi:hypothetical protein